MFTELIPIFAIGSFLATIVILVKITSDNKIRKQILDKGLDADAVKALFPKKWNGVGEGVSSALKWGIVLICVGLAFLIGQVVPVENPDNLTATCLFLFAGIGLVVYYRIEKKMKEEDESK